MPTRSAALIILAVATGSLWAQATQPADVTPRTAEAILAEYDATQVPAYDRSKAREPGYLQSYIKARHEAMAKQAKLARDLYDIAPNHERAGALMAARWSKLIYSRELDTVLAETEQFLAAHPDSSHVADALANRARAMGLKPEMAEQYKQVAAQFVDAYPEDYRCAPLLSMLASREQDPQAKVALLERIVDDYPKYRFIKNTRVELRRAKALGKPFELVFDDVLTGKRIDMKDLRGKVVVIDFWATWCAPCKAEFPHMKALYAKHKDQGFEIIGVSLDDSQAKGGLKKLKDYLAADPLPWLQYHQGNGFDSAFSRGWGVSSIPTLFIVDADGNLYSTDARGKLDTLIPELIKKRDTKKAG